MRLLVVLVVLVPTLPAHGQPKRSGVVATLSFEPSQDAGSSLLVLAVARDGRLYLGSSLVPTPRLAGILRSNVKIQATKQIGLSVDGVIPTSRLIEILSELRSAGIQKALLLKQLPNPTPPPRKKR